MDQQMWILSAEIGVLLIVLFALLASFDPAPFSNPIPPQEFVAGRETGQPRVVIDQDMDPPFKDGANQESLSFRPYLETINVDANMISAGLKLKNSSGEHPEQQAGNGVAMETAGANLHLPNAMTTSRLRSLVRIVLQVCLPYSQPDLSLTEDIIMLRILLYNQNVSIGTSEIFTEKNTNQASSETNFHQDRHKGHGFGRHNLVRDAVYYEPPADKASRDVVSGIHDKPNSKRIRQILHAKRRKIRHVTESLTNSDRNKAQKRTRNQANHDFSISDSNLGLNNGGSISPSSSRAITRLARELSQLNKGAELALWRRVIVTVMGFTEDTHTVDNFQARVKHIKSPSSTEQGSTISGALLEYDLAGTPRENGDNLHQNGDYHRRNGDIPRNVLLLNQKQQTESRHERLKQLSHNVITQGKNAGELIRENSPLPASNTQALGPGAKSMNAVSPDSKALSYHKLVFSKPHHSLTSGTINLSPSRPKPGWESSTRKDYSTGNIAASERDVKYHDKLLWLSHEKSDRNAETATKDSIGYKKLSVTSNRNNGDADIVSSLDREKNRWISYKKNDPDADVISSLNRAINDNQIPSLINQHYANPASTQAEFPAISVQRNIAGSHHGQSKSSGYATNLPLTSNDDHYQDSPAPALAVHDLAKNIGTVRDEIANRRLEIRGHKFDQGSINLDNEGDAPSRMKRARHKRDSGSANSEIAPEKKLPIREVDESSHNTSVEIQPHKTPQNSSEDAEKKEERAETAAELAYRSQFMGLVDTRGRDLNLGSSEQQPEKTMNFDEPQLGNEFEEHDTEPDVATTETETESITAEATTESETKSPSDNIEKEVILPEALGENDPEPESETEPESEPESEAEPESEPKSETEPENEPESESENETEAENEPEGESGENGLAEPEPAWDIAKAEWQEAWEIHIYLVGILFTLLAIFSLVAILRLWRRQNLLSRGYFLSLNAMMLIMGSCRGTYFLIDGYNSNNTFPPVTSYLLYGIGFPCLTSAFSILFLALLNTTRVQMVSRRVLKPVVLVVVIAFHFMLSISTDITVGYFLKARIMLLVCQIFFVVWGFVLFSGYIFIFRALIMSARRRHIEAMRLNESYRNLNGSPLKKRPKLTLNLAVKVTLITAICGLLCAGLQIYAMVDIYGTSSDQIPEPWPWWGFKFSMRIVELCMCFTMSYVATQPLRYNSTESTSTTIGNYFLPCRRMCVCNETANESETAFIDDSYQSPNGYFQNITPDSGDGPGFPTTTDVDQSFLMTQPSEQATSRDGTLESGQRSRPLSMLVDDNGFIRFREEGDPEEAAVMYSTDDDLGSCGDMVDYRDIIRNGHLPHEHQADVFYECQPMENFPRSSISVPNTGANTPMTPRSFYSADSEGAFSEFNFRPPSSIHLRDSIDRALNYPHFTLRTPDCTDTPDYLSGANTPDTNLNRQSSHNVPVSPPTSTPVHYDSKVYPSNTHGVLMRRKSSLRSILNHLNKSRGSSRQTSRRGSEDMLSRGSLASLGFKSAASTSGYRSNVSLSFFDDMSFKTSVLDRFNTSHANSTPVHDKLCQSESNQI